jgi:superfamily II DNA or RNA helicase
LVQILVTVDVVSEGFDVPAASVAILLRPTKSLGLYLQQVGRVLRPAPGKQAALILDHVGNVTRHGFPDDHRDWTLDDGIKRTAGTAAPSVRTCPECYAAFKPQPICPVCGTQCAPKARAIRQTDGQLLELTRDAVRRSQRRDQGQARTLQQLLTLAAQRGYSLGWAYRIYHARGQR